MIYPDTQGELYAQQALGLHLQQSQHAKSNGVSRAEYATPIEHHQCEHKRSRWVWVAVIAAVVIGMLAIR